MSRFAQNRNAGRVQTRTKAFETISFPSRLIHRRPVLPFQSKNVLDSKMMVGGIWTNLCDKIRAKKEGRANPNTATKSTKAFEIISHPSRLIRRRTVLRFHGRSSLVTNMMVEGIKPKVYELICAKKTGMANTITATKHV